MEVVQIQRSPNEAKIGSKLHMFSERRGEKRETIFELNSKLSSAGGHIAGWKCVRI